MRERESNRGGKENANQTKKGAPRRRFPLFLSFNVFNHSYLARRKSPAIACLSLRSSRLLRDNAECVKRKTNNEEERQQRGGFLSTSLLIGLREKSESEKLVFFGRRRRSLSHRRSLHSLLSLAVVVSSRSLFATVAADSAGAFPCFLSRLPAPCSRAGKERRFRVRKKHKRSRLADRDDGGEDKRFRLPSNESAAPFDRPPSAPAGRVLLCASSASAP